jgi:uncharacterized protein (DUF697 family)
MFTSVRELFPFGKRPGPDELDRRLDGLREKVPVPGIWLFGKTGSGKSSIIRYLLSSPDDAAIGNGFRPHTKLTSRFEFPDSGEPLMRFFDTRGLGESSYDPGEDIESLAHQSHMMVVAVRAADQALDSVISPLREIRERAPSRPVLLAVTCLHEAIPGRDITEAPDPFEEGADRKPFEESHPQLAILIEHKRQQFEGLADRVVPIDLTRPSDGFADPNFGGSRLKHAILESLPHAYRHALIALPSGGTRYESERRRKSQIQVLTSSSLAATAAAFPLPLIDIPSVLAIQTHLAYRIAGIYDQEITPANWAVLSSVAGGRALIQLAARELLKLIPFVGMGVSAAGSFIVTYAMGMTWDWYFSSVRHGRVPPPEQLREKFAEQLLSARRLFQREEPQ